MSNGAQKNMLKAWNFNQMKIPHRHSDNNLQKIFRKHILENANGQVLFMVILKVGLCLEIFLSVWVFFHLTFMNHRTAGERWRPILTPRYHIHLLPISQTIAAESLPLHMASDQTQNGNLWFPSASC